jgi:hypothetical protein
MASIWQQKERRERDPERASEQTVNWLTCRGVPRSDAELMQKRWPGAVVNM